MPDDADFLEMPLTSVDPDAHLDLAVLREAMAQHVQHLLEWINTVDLDSEP